MTVSDREMAPGNRQTTYHHPAEHPCDSSGGRAAPGHALALHLWPGALPEPPMESGGDTHPRSCELPGASVFDLSVSARSLAGSEGPGPQNRKQKQACFLTVT